MTQNDKILRHIKEYGAISSMEAFTEYGCTRLSARISDLRHQGHNIHAERRTSRNRYGEKVSFCLYWLED